MTLSPKWVCLPGPPSIVTDRDEPPSGKKTAAVPGLGRLTYYGRVAQSDGGARLVIGVDEDEGFYSVPLYRWMGSPR